MTLQAGTRLGLYEILSPLGAGGMGEVYRARDRKLDRDVAIKVLPQSVAADPDTLARFEREAKAVAALSHPNILSIFDFGNQDGTAYAVMELLEGETLRGKLDTGAIPQKQAVDYALQVARGLSAAHEKGIVHRDLKPENLFVSRDGHVKILDFGLAKRVEAVAPGKETSAPTGSGHTQPGTVMGTVGYMSPEQVKGLSVDHRSDIFSFGAILYELLSGKKAFRRDTSAETMAAILRDDPEELTASARNIPPTLDRIVRHCLEKDRDHRFQSARDIAFSLSEQLSPAAMSGPREPAPPLPSAGFWVAVLPFKVRGADAGVESLAEGLNEDIVTGLSRFSYLKVIARSSTSRYAGDAIDVRSVGRELGARYALEGAVRKSGGTVRVSIELLDASTGAHLWADSYDRNLDASSLFEIQDELTDRIVGTIADSAGVLVRTMTTSVRGRPVDELTADELVLRCFAHMQQMLPAEHAMLRDALEKVTRQQPNHAEAWGWLSMVYLQEHQHQANPRPGSLERALAAARRSVELDPACQVGRVHLASVYFHQRDFGAFRSAAERAIALNPRDTHFVGVMGVMTAWSGDWERGLEITRQAMKLNPNHPGWLHIPFFHSLYKQRKFEEALQAANKIQMPEFQWNWFVLAAVYGQLGRTAEAQDAVRKLKGLGIGSLEQARREQEKWFVDGELVDLMMEGLRKAGLGDEKGPRAAQGPSSSRPPAAISTEAESGQVRVRAEEGFWVAVLPFKYGGADTALTALAEGLTEEIVTGLSRFSYLRVIARSSTSPLVNQAVDVRSAGKELGARYVMEGSLRQAGTKLRLAVQLVDAISGAHLWAENYERPFDPEAVFELQDDLVPRIVSTVADQYGALVHSMSESLRGKTAGEYSPHEALLRAFGYWERMTPEEHAEVRDILEAAVAVAPDHSDCLAGLAMIYWHEYAFGYNLRPDPLGRARAAAQRAVASAPSSHFAHCALATGLFFQKDYLAFRTAAERALALNRMDSSTAAILGNMIAYAGDWEYGLGIVERAMQLNPHHAGWYHYVAFCDAYRRRDYRGALASALKVNMPAYHWPYVYLAAVYGQLGEPQRARTALRELDALVPNFGTMAREEFGKWLDAELTEHLLDGLRKAGLEIPPEKGTSAAAHDLARPSTTDSGAARADEGFWVAVLPFKYGGASADLAALAEGLTEDIVTGLSRFSYLRVIARSSTSRYAIEAVDVRSAGKELGARYVMEGSLRQAGARLRLAVQLVDAVSGAHLWAENYERAFSPEAVFELQDDLVPRIVSTVADMHGILPRTMSEALRSRTPEQLSPYEAVMRSFGYSARVTPEELAAARSGLELAVQRAPDYADAWAMLAWLCIQDYAQSFNLQADSLASGLTAARRAVEAAPSNHLAHCMLAQALFFHREFQSFRNAAERSVALNPMNGDSVAFLGELLTYAGDRERGLELAGRAKQLNPNHPGWYWYADFYDAYRRGDDRGALAAALKVNLPGQWFSHAATAAACGQLGDREAANRALKDLLKLRPDFAATVRSDIEKWWEPEYVERLIDGWRKAGLQIPGEKTTAAREAAVAIAVLPFADMSAAKDQEYLCEGMAEEIMNALVRVGGIRVASRTSTFQARRQGADLSAIGKLLSVGQVLEGSVRTAGDRLRVTAQLTDVGSGFQLWSERFDREAEDVFAVQDEIARGVVDAVKAHLSPGERAIHARPQPTNLEAYRSYLKGRHLRGKEDHAGALRAFEEAVRLDPSHAPSWTGLAEITVLASVFGMIPARDACATARKALATASRLQGESAEGLHVEAFVAWIEKRWAAMEAAWRRAIELQPNNVLALASFGIVLCTRQRLDEALSFLERARQADPLSSFPYALTGGGLLNCGRPQEALRYLEDALSFEKEDATALDNAGMARVALGRFEEGIATLEHVVAVSHRGAHFLGTLGWALATAGRKGEARAILAELRARPPEAPAVVSEAWLLGALGEVDAAFEVVARAEEECLAYVYFTGVPGFDPLRADPRFGAFLDRLELPREWRTGAP